MAFSGAAGDSLAGIEDRDVDEESESDTEFSDTEAEESEPEEEAQRQVEEFMAGSSSKRRRSSYRALLKKPEERTEADMLEIFDVAMGTVKDAIIANMEDKVKKALCSRLVLEVLPEGHIIMDFGEIGEKAHIIWSGKVQVDIPAGKVGGEADKELVTVKTISRGHICGERALLEVGSRRNARITTCEATKLLTFSKEDYDWSMGFSGENIVKDRISFLQALDRNCLGNLDELDLTTMAGYLKEESFIGDQVILAQGAEVDRIVFIKSGFCKVVREIHPKFHEMFDHFAEQNAPSLSHPGDRFRTAGEVDGEVDSDGRPHPGVAFRNALARTAAQHSDLATVARGAAPKAAGKQGRPAVARSGSADCSSADIRGSSTLEGSNVMVPASATVIVDYLQGGRSFGCTELFEVLPYQSSLVAHPWATVYTVSKYDLLRNTPKACLHRLFCDYRMRLSDERLMQRLKQKNRWNSYKRDLLDDIQSRKNRDKFSVIDRRAPPPRRSGVGALTSADYRRVGMGESLWNSRAHTPPKPQYANAKGHDVLHVKSFTKEDGQKDVEIWCERRDASLAALDERIVEMMTSSTRRAQGRRLQTHALTLPEIAEARPVEAPGAEARTGDPAAAALSAGTGAAPRSARPSPGRGTTQAIDMGTKGLSGSGRAPASAREHRPLGTLTVGGGGGGRLGRGGTGASRRGSRDSAVPASGPDG